MARLIPEQAWLEITRTTGQLATDVANHAARTGKTSLQREHRELTDEFLDAVEADMPPDQVASRFREYINQSQALMGTDWWTEVQATTRGALVKAAEGLDYAGQQYDRVKEAAKSAAIQAARAAKAAGKSAVEAAAAGSAAASKVLASFIGPIFPFALIGAGTLLAVYVYTRQKATE